MLSWVGSVVSYMALSNAEPSAMCMDHDPFNLQLQCPELRFVERHISFIVRQASSDFPQFLQAGSLI